MQLIVIKHSILSGLFAAFAAVFGKLGTTPSISRSALSLLSFIPEDYFEVSLFFCNSIYIFESSGFSHILVRRMDCSIRRRRTDDRVQCDHVVAIFSGTCFLKDHFACHGCQYSFKFYFYGMDCSNNFYINNNNHCPLIRH